MPTVNKIEGVKGISFKLTAYLGYNAKGVQIRKFKTWKPDPKMTLKQAEKEAVKQAQLFEDMLNNGLVGYDGKVTFETYAERWINSAQIEVKTRERYISLLVRINQAIGHIKLEKLQAHHLEEFYKNLSESGVKNKGLFAVSILLDQVMKERLMTRDKLSKMANLAPSTVGTARLGKKISVESAEKIAQALEMPITKLFETVKNTSGLAEKTILHHHRVISVILEKAKRERIIPFNVASEHATAPKVSRKEAIFLSDVQAQEIVQLLLDEDDIRKKACILTLLYSGIRRGELCGLSWFDIDFENSLMHVKRASQWQKDNGIVEVTTKNESSVRVIRLPQFLISILEEYKQWWDNEEINNGSKWKGNKKRLFIQSDGKPINPDTINYWIDKFIEKNSLPHFTPHSLRHTFATLQIMAGVNIRTVQARTGHSQASTLVNIYSHALKTADELATQALDDILTPKINSESDTNF